MELNDKIKCPSCNKEINKLANLCIHCRVNLIQHRKDHFPFNDEDNEIFHQPISTTQSYTEANKLQKLFPNDSSRKFKKISNLFLGALVIFLSVSILITQPKEMVFCWLYSLGIVANIYGIFNFYIEVLNFYKTHTICEKCNYIYLRQSSHCGECGEENAVSTDLFYSFVWIIITIILWYQWGWFINNFNN